MLNTNWTQHRTDFQKFLPHLGRTFHWNALTSTTRSIVRFAVVAGVATAAAAVATVVVTTFIVVATVNDVVIRRHSRRRRHSPFLVDSNPPLHMSMSLGTS